MYCWKCKNEIKLERKISRTETCPFCNAYLHCCFNCIFYDKLAYHECKEPQAEWVKEKYIGNFCDYFSPKQDKPKIDETLSKEEASKKLSNLFKKNKL